MAVACLGVGACGCVVCARACVCACVPAPPPASAAPQRRRVHDRSASDPLACQAAAKDLSEVGGRGVGAFPSFHLRRPRCLHLRLRGLAGPSACRRPPPFLGAWSRRAVRLLPRRRLRAAVLASALLRSIDPEIVVLGAAQPSAPLVRSFSRQRLCRLRGERCDLRRPRLLRPLPGWTARSRRGGAVPASGCGAHSRAPCIPAAGQAPVLPPRRRMRPGAPAATPAATPPAAPAPVPAAVSLVSAARVCVCASVCACELLFRQPCSASLRQPCPQVRQLRRHLRLWQRRPLLCLPVAPQSRRPLPPGRAGTA